MKQGLSGNKLQFAMAQVAHETGGFNSRVSTVDNNFSGIKYIGKPLVQKNASKGSKSPEKNSYYARFSNVNDWARDYIRILNNSSALAAKNITDFSQRLKKGGYFTDSIENYTKGLIAWSKQMGMPVSIQMVMPLLPVLILIVGIAYLIQHQK